MRSMAGNTGEMSDTKYFGKSVGSRREESVMGMMMVDRDVK